MMRYLSILLAAVMTGTFVPRLHAQGADGRPLYLKHCRSCHGTSGAPTNQAKREYPKIRTLDAEFLSRLSVDSLVAVITNGFEKGDEMKPFRKKMTTLEIEAVARYLKEDLASTKPG